MFRTSDGMENVAIGYGATKYINTTGQNSTMITEYIDRIARRIFFVTGCCMIATLCIGKMYA